jgi:NADH dehydrogenase [ubiquinone] 1 alpha subcomplex assembly factor 7
MTPLLDIITKRIDAFGPISIADYMRECLLHPQHGYYQKQIVFGEKGDFITAPEISQMFGEIIGLQLAEKWLQLGKPAETQLIELGPGRGTLMADILRAARSIPEFHQSLNIHFIEASAQLRTLQREKVPTANWHEQIQDIPEGFSLIIANEFFDALPIHQYEKRDGIWFERMITHQKKSLEYTLSLPGPQFALVPHSAKDRANNSIFEVCPSGLSITGILSDRLKQAGGAAIIIDYGYTQSGGGDTFQALKDHKFISPLTEPGHADITAHVAFDQLAQTANEKDIKVEGPYEQGQYLMASGIGVRAQKLATGANSSKQKTILSELKRLTASDEMGQLFKVLMLEHNPYS